MALRGNLNDFTLPDVFQLIALSKKTGVLRMRRADGSEGNVWFRDGEVFFAESNWHRERLGERLVTAQKITPSALTRVLQLRAAEPENGRRLGRILVDEGYITDAVLEAFVREQVLEPIFDLMRWEEGEFDFEMTPQTPEEDIGLAVSIENIVMEGARRLEEWERIKKKVPSTDVVFKMATAPGEGSFEISLKPVEWNLLLLVDGTRSVAELARAAHWTEFDAARIVYGLHSAGLLEVVSDEEAARLREAMAEREAHAAAAASAPKAPAPVSTSTEPSAAPVTEPAPETVSTAPPGGEPAEVPEAEEVTGPAAEVEPGAEPVVEAEAEAEAEQPPVSVESAVPSEEWPEAQESQSETILYVDGEPATVEVELDVLPPETDILETPTPEAGQVQPEEARAAVEAELAALGLIATPDGVVEGEPPQVIEEPSHIEEPEEPEEAEEPEEPTHPAEEAPAGESGETVAEVLEVLMAEAETSETEVAVSFQEEAALLLEARADLGMSSAITDEITALTGVERAARPTASGGTPPAATAVPRRDANIDRGTLLDIIEGIKRL